MQLIKAKLAPSIEKQDELFDSASSPFATFSARIDLAYRLGLIRCSVRASFHLLRKIRNDFAHAVSSKDFSSGSTRSRIKEIFKLNREIILGMRETLGNSELPNLIDSQKMDRLVFELFIASSAAYLITEVSDVLPIAVLSQ